VRILLWHGYLLRGSGSNIYTANIAKVWRRQGHDVLLMCQERHPEALDFVDQHGDFDAENARWELRESSVAPESGSCIVLRPAIGDILPVYVYDEYEGFVAKRFVDLTDAELKEYLDRNVAAMTAAIAAYRPDAIVTGHEVMGPYIAREACGTTGTSYIAKLHGSALEYAVKEQERYLTYAMDGLGGATHVTGGSVYMVEEAARYIPGWRDKAVVVNPGCDVNLFGPQPDRNNEVPVVAYVGKFIEMKGVHNLLAALPATTSSLRSVIVGYGGFEGELRALAGGLAAGDAAHATQIARAAELDDLAVYLAAQPQPYWKRARSIEMRFPGRLEHGPLARVLPTFDLLVVPSILAEAFGMVAAEAAACGVLPIVPAHSGIGEVGAMLEADLGIPGELTFDPSDPIVGIAERIDALLAIPAGERALLSAEAARVARKRWSWERVAGDLLALTTAL
jgi:glycosyltransferase involved in cell wall biosynthesis